MLYSSFLLDNFSIEILIDFLLKELRCVYKEPTETRGQKDAMLMKYFFINPEGFITPEIVNSFYFSINL